MCPGGGGDDDDMNGNSSLTVWDKLEDKRFEQYLLVFPEDMPDRWQSIAAQLPGKSPADVREHYDALVNDVNLIVNGRVGVPNYPKLKCNKSNGAVRKKVSPWTVAEHKLFLLGLKRYGKGDWRSISRHVVITRDSTQVASHAQKFFHRHSSCSNKRRKRASIHDITTVDENLIPPRGGLIQQLPPLPMPVDQNWIPATGGLVQQQPLATDQQQLLALQLYPPPSQFPGQGSSKDYPNYGYLM